jgi:outer membrane protein assembly factor BamD
MEKKRLIKWVIFLPIILSLLFGCAGKGKEVKTIKGDPEILYKQGLARFNKRDYTEALKIFEQIKSSFPDSPPYTIWAEVKVGDCHFFKKDYVEAIAAYEEFKKIHPTHEDMPYVQYQIGMSHFNQIRTLDRDQTSTKKALSNFEYLVANYPPNIFTEKAKGKIGVCKKQLADNEFYVGNFYYKHGKYQAAASRFEVLLEKFPKIPQEDKTLYLLGKSYLELDQWEKAKEAFTKIVNEYPKSSHYKEAKAILDQGVKEKKVSFLFKTKTKKPKKEEETTEIDPERIPLIKFEAEGRQSVSFKEEREVELKKKEERVASLPTPSETIRSSSKEGDTEKIPPPMVKYYEEEKRLVGLQEEKKMELKKTEEEVVSLPVANEPVKPIFPEEESKKITPHSTGEQIQEERVKAVSSSQENKGIITPLGEDQIQDERIRTISPQPPSKEKPRIEVKPEDEKRIAALPIAPMASEVKEVTKEKEMPRKEITQKEEMPKAKEEEKRIAALPSPPTTPKEKELPKKGVPPEIGGVKLVDTGQPIDITSDRVETYSKENLIIFKGNVMARQKDILIYSDSLEAVVFEDGKGIEKVVAGGNVKIQQGLRVASCQKAVFYNLDQKVVLTGDPKVWEGGNMVSGDEIVFDIEQNRVEVKGGSGGRGKAKIHPGGEFEKLK